MGGVSECGRVPVCGGGLVERGDELLVILD